MRYIIKYLHKYLLTFYKVINTLDLITFAAKIEALEARWQTGNGANFNLFWERDALGILPKKVEVIISGALFLWFVSFWTNKKK